MLTMPYKTTCPIDDNHSFYDWLKDLHYTFSSSTNRFSLMQFSNIRNLSIDLSFDENLWKKLPIFYQLTSINVLPTDENPQFYLQSLLDRAPCLYSLIIQSWLFSQVPLVNNTHTSLDRLAIYEWMIINKVIHFFSREACESFIRSPLAI